MMSDVLDAIDAASAWLDIDGVEGVAQGSRNGKDCIVVGCSLPPAQLKDKIPDIFEGYPVVLEDWGVVSTQQV